MKGRRPGAGVRVSGGKLRVDAARAIDKLRSYQLADPLAWVLEVVRAGVVLPESTAIAVEGSGGDVFVAIACAPPAADALPRLFEELVDPSPAPEARGLRLLAMGVNAALGRAEGGTATRHVDVYVVEKEGTARVRFTPQLFTIDPETGLALGLRELRAEPATLPAHAPRPARGLLVHARAVMGLGMLARWALGEEPRELALVRDAARELRTPITVQGLPVPADPSIVLREPIEGGGFVALVAPRTGRVGAVLEAAEVGVVLSREPWLVALDTSAPLPLLLRVDRDRLPTNAARSAVRWDEPGAASALEDGTRALTVIVQRLAKEIDETKDEARLSWLRGIGIALLASEMRGASFREKLRAGVVRDVLAPLLDCRLLFDAIGRRRTPRELGRSSEARVHLRSTFAPADLAPWLGDVLAAPPGDPTHLLFDDLPPEPADGLLEIASTLRETQARWLARPVEPVVARGEDALLRVPLPKKVRLSGRAPISLEGEVALGVQGVDRVLDVRIGGRLLETRRTPAGAGVAIAVSSVDLTPAMTFDAVQEDDVLRAVLDAAREAELAGCEAIARALAGDDAKKRDAVMVDGARVRSEPDRAAALVRHAVLATVARDGDAARRAIFGKALGAAPLFRTLAGELVSLDALASADAIGVVEHRDRRPSRLPKGRHVLSLDDAERTALTLLMPRMRWVDYGRARVSSRSLAEITLSLGGRLKVGLASRGESFASVAAWCDGRETGIEAFHLGVRIGYHSARGKRVPVLVVVDDDRIVPDETWSASSAPWHALEQWHATDRASSRIARAVIARWLGRELPDLVATVDLDAPAVVRAVLLESQDAFDEPLTDAERAALAELPYFPSAGGARLPARAFVVDGQIAYVAPDAFANGLGAIGIDALAGSREEARGLAALVGARGVVDVTERARTALAAKKRADRLRAIASRDEETLDPWGATPTARILGDGLDGVVGYRPGGASRVSVLVDRRWLLDLEDPAFPPHVAAKITVEPRLLDDEANGLGSIGGPRVRGALHASARTLLSTIVAERPSALFRDGSVLALADHVIGGGRRRGETGALLRALMEPPTLTSSEGAAISIASAIHDDALLAVREPMPVVPPMPGEPESALDRPTAVVPWESADVAYVLLQKIAGVPIRDVTRERKALFAKRRAEQGLTARPTLSPGHEPALSRPVEKLAEATEDPDFVKGALGFGAIGLVAAPRASVRFFEDGEVRDTLVLELVPAFECAVASPRLDARGKLPAGARGDVERAVTMVLAQLLRRLADEKAFDAAPDWALDAQRDAALLGGATHLERLGPLRLFATTGGVRVSYADVVAQRKRFGVVWWTPDPSSKLVPLDPERFALRLTPAHARALGRVVALVDGTQELELDRVARENRARPPAPSLALGSTERAAAMAVETEGEGTEEELVVAVLWPAFAAMRTLALHLGPHPLGETTPPGTIPVIARARSSELEPNRTWSGAKRDAALSAIERAILERAETLVAGAIEAPGGAMPVVIVDAALMDGIPRPPERVVRGALTLGPLDLGLDEDDDEGVRLIDAGAQRPERVVPEPLRATPPKGEPCVVPLAGTLVLWGATAERAEGTLDAVLRHAYVRLLARVAGRLLAGKSPDADLDRAHLVRGAALGFVSSKDVPLDVPMPFGRDALGTLRGVVDVLGKQSAVVALAEGEDGSHEGLARHPKLVLDGSLAAQRLVLALGPRVITRSDALALALGLRKPNGQASLPPPPPPPAKKKQKESEPPPARKAKKTKARPAPEPVRASSGPVEPLAARTVAALQRIGLDAKVEVRASREEPLVVSVDGGLSLAGGSELLALAAGTAVHRERAAALVAAHAALTHGAPSTMASLARLLE